MKEDSFNDLISSFSDDISPVLKEYLLIPASVFFRINIKNVSALFGEKEADKYRAYTEKIKSAFAGDNDKDSPLLADVVKKGMNKRDERFSEAILYSVFIYPMKIIRERRS